MSEPKFRRFSGFHRVLHWSIAIPYMTLLASGALILLHHLGWVNAPSLKTLSTLHRWVGIAFTAIVIEMLLFAIVGGHWRSLLGDVFEWLTLRPRDFLWLICVPFNTCFPRYYRLPKAARYNAGQKLHGLFILVAVSGFIATGLAMIIVPGWLQVWLIHTWLFFGAAGFLGLHLFLAFVNPATRRALGGIFTGNVPHAYVEEHHALVLDSAPVAHRPHAAVSLKAIFLTGLIVASALGFWWYGPGRSLVLATIASPRENPMISPGPLVSVHAAKIHGDHCAECHTGAGPPTEAACITCHTEIRNAQDQAVGYHGKLSRDCASCHKEHRGTDADLRNFDARSFNHQLARFALNGAHRSLDCDKCHVQHSPSPGERRFVGLKSSACTDCHANPHVDMPQADCTKCHSEQNWRGRSLLFVHNRDSLFKLDAIHDALDCTSCHKQKSGSTVVFHGLPTTCEKCHTQIADGMAGRIGTLVMKADPHDGRVSCIDCHKPEIHSSTLAQFASQCERCHGVRYRSLLFEWQKSLDEREQAARLRLRQQIVTDSHAAQNALDGLSAAHAVGFHNVQEVIDVFEQIGRKTP